MRLPQSTYAYDDPEHPERVTRVISSPAYVAEDRALLMGLKLAEERSTCRCGEPIEVAWHSEMDGWYERRDFVCNGCTALAPDPETGTKQPVVHSQLVNTRPASKPPLPPFALGVTTTAG